MLSEKVKKDLEWFLTPEWKKWYAGQLRDIDETVRYANLIPSESEIVKNDLISYTLFCAAEECICVKGKKLVQEYNYILNNERSSPAKDQKLIKLEKEINLYSDWKDYINNNAKTLEDRYRKAQKKVGLNNQDCDMKLGRDVSLKISKSR